jgi:hypothetical protein
VTRQCFGLSFRDGPKAQTSDVQLHIGESRDSGFDASHRPGMTVSDVSRSLSPALGRERAAASAQADILQLGQGADRNRLRGDKDFPKQIRCYRAREQ